MALKMLGASLILKEDFDSQTLRGNKLFVFPIRYVNQSFPLNISQNFEGSAHANFGGLYFHLRLKVVTLVLNNRP